VYGADGAPAQEPATAVLVHKPDPSLFQLPMAALPAQAMPARAAPTIRHAHRPVYPMDRVVRVIVLAAMATATAVHAKTHKRNAKVRADRAEAVIPAVRAWSAMATRPKNRTNAGLLPQPTGTALVHGALVKETAVLVHRLIQSQ
jgi:hypothetical protein